MRKENNVLTTFSLVLPSDVMDLADLLGTGWAFRGQADVEWPIASSLEREVSRRYRPGPTGWLENSIQCGFEGFALARIRSARSTIEEAVTNEMDAFSWLALLQHHGCKTRMVDFTESFYVALYFAIRDLPDSDAAIWAIATAPLRERTRSLFKNSTEQLSEEDVSRRLVNNSIDWPDRYEEDDRFAVVCGKPQYLNQRLIAQQGIFLCPLNLKLSFMDNLCAGLDMTSKAISTIDNMEELKAAVPKVEVIRITIPRSEHISLISHLRKMNITDASLFPGLDGFARSLNLRIGDVG
ncbi:MAG TPA: hypothetical protein DCZ95_03345 [Verrucomicrobia bacterium]|nr:MAG: hypothetical protein A2X46_01620 [Lentisphaerae bacterium GWF2_57_35]HBA83108.1 hypothetical protein [Verrucomicrobiota bacterium]